jgi:hypothetical protein
MINISAEVLSLVQSRHYILVQSASFISELI